MFANEMQKKSVPKHQDAFKENILTYFNRTIFLTCDTSPALSL